MSMIKKGDTVYIIKGKERGKTGRIVRVLKDSTRVVVEGANMYKKHARPKQQGQKGEIISVSRSIHASNVMRVCGKCGVRTRRGHSVANGTKIEVCKKCHAEL
ncbi:MAG: 50S ribosomal protein L24 [Patescibacteria group bacterium]|nr:50S ribosomal protein L24 [Patescibacteria group bacterium]MDE2437818.1 50S ribosomal protein L24 [Patescibacteria group bacterium]